VQLITRTNAWADIGVVVTGKGATKQWHPVFKSSLAHLKMNLLIISASVVEKWMRGLRRIDRLGYALRMNQLL
jgi:hypothetical protein